MKNRPIHENLDTSFVNLSALVRYLRRRQFAGSIRIELSGYEADIVLTAENQMKVREYDRIAGRIAEGEEALQRLLIRAREPGGVIHVYQTVAETDEVEQKSEVIEKAEKIEKIEEKEATTQPVPVHALNKTTAAGGNGRSELSEAKPVPPTPPAIRLPNIKAVTVPVVKKDLPPAEIKHAPAKLPKLPFELTNKVESKVKQIQPSPQDWQTLLNLIGELLKTFDDCLAAAHLDFSAAFQKACQEISADYPFLHPVTGSLSYQNGKLEMHEQISPKLFSASINETLRRILEKLGTNPKFAEVHRTTSQRIIALIHQRKPFYDNFSITPQLEKNLGIS